jgi:hypothetical protein
MDECSALNESVRLTRADRFRARQTTPPQIAKARIEEET